jgi:DNA polymerase III epsilon subunit family exonuclease
MIEQPGSTQLDAAQKTFSSRFARASTTLKPAQKYWVFLFGIALAVFGVILSSVAGSWYNLTPEEQRMVRGMTDSIIPFPLMGAFALFLIIGGLTSLLFRYYIIPILQMAEATRLISLVNPDYRIEPNGALEVRQLAGIINDYADAYRKLRTEVDDVINTSRAELTEERNRFAALMSELPGGVLVCTEDGRIMLYNKQARSLLQPSNRDTSTAAGPGGWLGLGRSVFDVLQKEPVIHGLKLLQQAVSLGQETPVTRFMTSLNGGRCLRVTMAPVSGFRCEQRDERMLCEQRDITGFVLTLEEITAQIEADTRRDLQVRAFTDSMQAVVEEIRQSLNTLQDSPDLKPEQLRHFRSKLENTNATLQHQLQLARENDTPNLLLFSRDADEETPGSSDLASRHGGSIAARPLAELPPPREPRPVYYEFDLFQQQGLQEFAGLPLRRLTYVVFDMETTGLNLSGGDEIIQIGAVRIVNLHLLHDEAIDQLIDPRRPIPEESVAIHGITSVMVAGQPTIDQVLPHFRSFVDGAVLVAHNAAFDMRCLQLKEKQSGLRFDNPVLDTLLLSSLVHPHQDIHSLDGIARRLNLTIVGRHTALGDAIVTAEVLLKLIPLLEAQGILTLEDALLASKRSPFARLSY